MTKKPLRGEIWLIDLDPTKGHEQAKLRPCLIISANEFNLSLSNLIIILPITTKHRNLPTFIKVDSSESNLKFDSYIICEQIRTVSLLRVQKTKIGQVNNNTLKKVEICISRLLDFNKLTNKLN